MLGFLITIFAGFLLSLSIVLLFFAYAKGIQAELVVVIRYIIMFIMLSMYLKFNKKFDNIASFASILKQHFHRNWFISGLLFIQTYSIVSSVKYIPAGLAIIILYTFPLITYLLQLFFKQEQITIVNIIAIVFGFIGVFLTIELTAFNFNLVGISFAFCASFSQATLAIIAQNKMRELGAEQLMWLSALQICLFIPLLYILFFGVDQSMRFIDIRSYLLDFKDYPNMINNGLVITIFACFCYALGITLFYYSIKLTSATQASILLFSEPAFTVILAYVLLNENISSQQFIGLFCIILAGICLSIFRKKIYS